MKTAAILQKTISAFLNVFNFMHHRCTDTINRVSAEYHLTNKTNIIISNANYCVSAECHITNEMKIIFSNAHNRIPANNHQINKSDDSANIDCTDAINRVSTTNI